MGTCFSGRTNASKSLFGVETHRAGRTRVGRAVLFAAYARQVTAVAIVRRAYAPVLIVVHETTIVEQVVHPLVVGATPLRNYSYI